MKKATLSIVAAILCALLLAGCAAGDGTQTGEGETNGATATPEMQNTPAPSPASAEGEAEATEQPDNTALIGPVLTADIDQSLAQAVGTNDNADGTGTEELIYDSVIYIEYARLLPTQLGDEQNTIAALSGVDPESIMMTDVNIEGLSSYPVYRAEYTQGENEDTSYCVDVLVHIDGWDLLFHTSTPADLIEDYSDVVEGWVQSLSIVD